MVAKLFVPTQSERVCHRMQTPETKNQEKGVSELYPVPSRGQIVLDNLPTGTNHIRVFTLEGKLVRDETTNSTKHLMDLSELQSGLYLVVVQNGDQRMHKKMVLTR